jgi:hypothetical protein
VLTFSRSFYDIHDVQKTKEFQDNFDLIKKKIEPFYIIKKKMWWIGVKDVEPNNFDLIKTLKKINRIGMCCGFVPKGMM